MNAKNSIKSKSKTITVKRENWAGKRAGYQSVGRENGRFVATKKWHSSSDTQKVITYVATKRPEYQPPKRYVAARPAVPRRFYPTEKPVKYDIVLRVVSTLNAKHYVVMHSRERHLSNEQMQYYVDKLKMKDEYHFGKVKYVEEVRVSDSISGDLIWKEST